MSNMTVSVSPHIKDKASTTTIMRDVLIALVPALIASVLIYRPFCKYFCPLGALYGLVNRFSVYQMKVDDSKCTNCGACTRACKMQVDVTKNINSVECIRCGKCKEVCPSDAICTGFMKTSGAKAKPNNAAEK